MLFDLSHSLYVAISTLITIVVLILASLYLKEQKYKDLFLKFFAVVTVILHYSDWIVDFLTTGTAQVVAAQLFAIAPCHVCMWLLIACAFIKNKNTIWFRLVSEFTFYLGILGGALGIALNFSYIDNPTLANWFVLHGLLGHSTMMIGCIWLLCGKYIKIRVFNVVSIIFGLLILFFDGMFVNLVFEWCNLPAVNSMYLLEPPFENYPWFNPAFFGVLSLVLVFLITSVYEQFALKKEDRWYVKLSYFYNLKIKDKAKKHDKED